jgi:hypothetical protein
MRGRASNDEVSLLFVHKTLGPLLCVGMRQGPPLILGQFVDERVLGLGVAVEASRLSLVALFEVERSHEVVREAQLHHLLHLQLGILGIQNQFPDLVVLRTPLDGPVLWDCV